jgi:predicted acyl esterase
MRRVRVGLLLSSVLALVTGAALVVPPVPADAGTLPPVPRLTQITARDGVVLRANVVEPPAAGRKPGVVFVNSWGFNDVEYLAQANALAQRGYVVLSYTTRGFGLSGGTVQVAGPQDVADVSDAIDWMIANTSVDPARIGVAGVSYGAGIGLIASGHDPRIRAVLALSGWTDLVESLYGGQTRRLQAVGFLGVVAQLSGRPSPELRQMLADYFANRNIAGVKAWGRVRGAATHLDAINRNRPAIYLANAYGDSIFAPNQLVDFYGRLTGPKRLELAPGDHAIVELTGLAGLPNHVWTDAGRWLDRYVAGTANGVDRENPVVLRSKTSPAVESYRDWAAVGDSSVRYALAPSALPLGTGTLAAGRPGTAAGPSITTGVDTTADAGVMMLSNGAEALTGVQPLVSLPTVSRLNAGVWTSPRLPAGAAVRGIAQLRLRARQQPAGTVVAYLYDVDTLGTGRLITHAPMTWTGAGRAVSLDVALPATSYDVPAGHRLALVVDTVDPLYADRGRLGARLTFAGPSWLDIPVR